MACVAAVYILGLNLTFQDVCHICSRRATQPAVLVDRLLFPELQCYIKSDVTRYSSDIAGQLIQQCYVNVGWTSARTASRAIQSTG